MTKPVITSVGLSPIGQTDLPGRDLFSVALEEAFDGLPAPAEVVEALYAGNQSEQYEHQIMYGTLLAEWAGLRHIPAERVEGCAAAGALALKHAVEDVRTGTHEAVLACGVEKMTAGGTGGATDSLSGNPANVILSQHTYSRRFLRHLAQTQPKYPELARTVQRTPRLPGPGAACSQRTLYVHYSPGKWPPW